MTDPMLVATAIGASLLAMLVVGVVLSRSLVDVPSGHALVLRSSSGMQRVRFVRTLVIPFMQSAELVDMSTRILSTERSGGDNGVQCRDGIRASLTAVFSVAVNATEEDILEVCRKHGATRIADQKIVRALFHAKFSEALDIVIAKYDFDHLGPRLDDVREQIIEFIGRDLDGFVLEDVSIADLRMVPAAELDPEDPHDARGIAKITEVSSRMKVKAAEANSRMRTQVARLELQEREMLLEMERQHDKLAMADRSQGGRARELDELRERVEDKVKSIVSLVKDELEDEHAP